MIIDQPARIDIREGVERHAVTLRFLIDPARKRLFHRPAARAFEPQGRRFGLVASANGTCGVSTPVSVAMPVTRYLVDPNIIELVDDAKGARGGPA